MNTKELPLAKQTKLGLYLTSSEAHSKLEGSSGTVKILDVRTVEEYVLVGHAPMAINIPLAVQTHEWNENKTDFTWKPLPDFLDQVRQVFGPEDEILVTCRSGGRSAMAVNVLAAAGFKNVYNITDGFEGDKEMDKTSVNYGKHSVNGWKNSNLPWTYELNHRLMVLPTI